MKLGRPRLEQAGLALIAAMVLALVGLNAPRAAALLQPPAPTPTPLPAETPPAAVLLQEELDRDLQGVYIVVSDTGSGQVRVGTAFAVGVGEVLTSAELVRGATAMRLIDPTGGSHRASLVAVDEVHAVALVRLPAGTAALPLGDSAGLHVHDPLALLGPAKAAALKPSTPVSVSAVGVQATGSQGSVGGLLTLAGDFRPASSGAPVVGPGGRIMAIAVLVPESETMSGLAMPISSLVPELAAWRQRVAGPLLPLADVPGSLSLRGLDETASGPAATTTTSAPTGPVSLRSVAPARALSSQSTVLTLRGSGFISGPLLRVHFLASASLSGSFDGMRAAVNDPSTITVTVPAGMRIQDYAIEVVNGNGSVAGSRLSFTVVP